MIRLLPLLFALLAPVPAMAQAAREALPIPRFVSLRSEEVNLRTGPGVRYPVEWVFVRRQMPVEILQEFENWRRVRDREGTHRIVEARAQRLDALGAHGEPGGGMVPAEAHE